MSDPAVPAPPPAARLSAIERGVRRHRIMERAPCGWSYVQRVRTAVDDEARAVRAGKPDGGAPQRPGRLQFARNPLISLDRPRNEFPNASKWIRAMRPAAIPTWVVRAREVGRGGEGMSPARLQFACNPLICLDRAKK
jgi:hypothetical protein